MLTVLILSHPVFTMRFDPIATHISRTKDSPYVLVFHHSIFFLLLQILGDEVASLDYFSFVTLFFSSQLLHLSSKLHSLSPIKKFPLYYSFIIMSMNVFIDVSL